MWHTYATDTAGQEKAMDCDITTAQRNCAQWMKSATYEFKLSVHSHYIQDKEN